MNNLSNIWTQSNCLSKSQLMNYIQQNLDPDEVYLVESHLNDCAICSDAIDGLFEADLEIAQKDISEIKVQLEEKIKELHPIQKPQFISTKRSNIENNNKATPTLTSTSSNRNRWLVAASVLLFMGLGGYSVYSFIKSQDQQLAQNTKSDDGQEASYNKPEDPNANEITTLRINPPDSLKSSPSDEKFESKKSTPPPATVLKSPNLVNEPPQPKAVEKDIQTTNKRDEDKAIQTDESQANYLEEVKATNSEQIVKGKKKSSVGMSNSKYNATQNSKELSYPTPQNNSNNSNNYSQNSTDDNNYKSIPNKPKIELTDYENGMSNYNSGNFKTSIDYFKKALKNAAGEQKEDILYHLAQAYLQTGKRNKAEKIFEELALGEKYKTEASKELQKTKK